MNLTKDLERFREQLVERGAITEAGLIEAALKVLDTRNDRLANLMNERDQAFAHAKTAHDNLEKAIGDYVEMRDKWKAESKRMFRVIEKVGELNDVPERDSGEFAAKLAEMFESLLAYRRHEG